MEQWEVERCSGVCTATGRTLEENEEHYAVLFEEGESFRRADYSLDGWTGPPAESFCFFKTRVPVREKKKRLLVDDDVLINFFTRLAEEDQDARINFRFVLALILMRKRHLKYEDTEHENGDEYWRMRLVRDQETHRVRNPRLTETQIEQVSQELGVILHGDALPDDAIEDVPTNEDSPAEGTPTGEAVPEGTPSGTATDAPSASAEKSEAVTAEREPDHA